MLNVISHESNWIHYTPIQMAKLKRLTIASVWDDSEWLIHSYTGICIENGSRIWKQFAIS